MHGLLISAYRGSEFPPQLPLHNNLPPVNGAFCLSPPARILIVDSSAEARDILSTLLRRQGAETIKAAGPSCATALLRQKTPDLIVFDVESSTSSSQEETLDLGRLASLSDTPIVVLGTTKRQIGPLTTEQFVSKPYHYGPLIRRIESLLGSQPAREMRG